MMVGKWIKQSRFSGLTDVRTVSYELSESDDSDFFSRCSDQTMRITEMDKETINNYNPIADPFEEEL